MINAFKDYKGNSPKISSLFDIDVKTIKVVQDKSVDVTLYIKVKSEWNTCHILLGDKFAAFVQGVTVTAHSKLHDGDTWNEQKGIDIAEHKARSKAYAKIASIIYNNAAQLDKKAVSMRSIAKYFNKKAAKQAMHYNELGK